jgi:autotransporter-associated beta strand protein
MKKNTKAKIPTPASFSSLALLLALAAPLTAPAQFTFINFSPGTNAWTDAANWDASGVPTSSAATTVTFFGDVVTPLGDNLVVNADPASLTLNTLSLNGLASASTNSVVTLGTAGNVWTFDGTAPTVNLNGLKNKGTNALTFTFLPDLVLTRDLTFAGTGAATFNFAGTLNCPNATLNVSNGAVNNSGTITINTLLATNNTAASTNSLLTFNNSSVLNTSNTLLVIPNSGTLVLKGTWNMNSGVHQFQELANAGLQCPGQINVRPGATLNLGTNTSNWKPTIGYPNSRGGGVLVDNASMVGAVSYLGVGLNTSGIGAQMVVTNGSQVFLAGPTALGSGFFQVGVGNGASSNSVIVAGTNAAGQRAWVDLGGLRTYIGSGSYPCTNNWMLVGAGGVVTNTYLTMWGATPGSSSTVIITNGGQFVTTSGGASVGRTGNNAEVIVAGKDAAGNPATFNLGNGNLIIGGDNLAGTNCGVWVDSGGVVTNARVYAGGSSTANDVGASFNYLVITNGGQVFSSTNSGDQNIGYARLANSNSVVITGAGSRWDLGGNSLALSKVYTGTNNILTVANGGAFTNFSFINIYGANNGVILNGGTLAPVAGGNFIRTNTGGNITFPFVNIQSGGATINAGANQINSILPLTEDPASVGGGLTVLGVNGSGSLTLPDSNTYTGPTIVSSGALQLVTPTSLSPSTAVHLNTTNGSLNLAFTGTNVVADLYINGTRLPKGVYGAETAPITGTGFLQVSVGGTSAPPTLAYTVSGAAGSQNLNFSWTGSFKLQSQTNSVSVGLSTNWHDYPGGGTSPVSVPVNANAGAVFFRLAPLP